MEGLKSARIPRNL